MGLQAASLLAPRVGAGCQVNGFDCLHAAMAPYVLLYIESLGGATPSATEHVGLLDACRGGDVDGAVTLLQSHLADASAAVIDFLGSSETAGSKSDG